MTESYFLDENRKRRRVFIFIGAEGEKVEIVNERITVTRENHIITSLD